MRVSPNRDKRDGEKLEACVNESMPPKLHQVREHKQAPIQVEKLKEAISVIEGLGTNSLELQ